MSWSIGTLVAASGFLFGIATSTAMATEPSSGHQQEGTRSVADANALNPVTDPEILRRLNDSAGDSPGSTLVEEAQRNLKELGYYPGTVDGIIGPATREAMRAFQADHEMRVDGKFSGVLAFKIELEVSEARRRATPEGQARERDRQRLLAMSQQELMARFKAASADRKQEMLGLLGDRASELPAGFVFDMLGKPGLTEAIAIPLLSTLQYPRSPESIGLFQQDLGSDPTGELTIGQLEELTRRQSLTRKELSDLSRL